MSARIVSVRCGVVRRALRQPYRLSFATLSHVDSVWVGVVFEDGRCGVGEAVPLPGYGGGTLDEVRDAVRGLCAGLVGHTARDALSGAVGQAARGPLAVSAVASALEFPDLAGRCAAILRVPLVFPLDPADGGSAVLCAMEDALSEGFTEFKMKIGRDLASDVAAALLALERAADVGAMVRFDANQAYTRAEAQTFCEAVNGGASEELRWLEQPLAREDWEGTAMLCASTRVPIMLDEPIYAEEDVDRAARVGAAAVKLKLCKHPGPQACVDLARRAVGAGLAVTLGNGVSTDIGNICEAMVAAELGDALTGALECNGFARLAAPALFSGLRSDRGCLVADAPRLDEAKLDALARESSWLAG
ncbi:L-alanine-DL-glutamate epimerase-like enolase superfamily enzyme [Desulfobaculum xiamenense]|uniref:L-alanine-DL-glutamate epimerase-like enolase superfamily enzyme n=1 Tax=Desulfobaculum xiamenense TaxID=995050 RepID=A0A846QS48_9BACT|nr:mandelate racemase/muconate lactonizing enzyme family protein [Desulfobaculum xiamenense]NJB69193.1 L-alanine-DL-glutamate epimerase-like enolase superfamily enzyme [Desulfobaculum xiamenense]